MARGSSPARDMSWRSTTSPRNQLSRAIPIASAKSTIAATHATGLRATGTPPTFDCCYPKYVRDNANATNG